MAASPRACAQDRQALELTGEGLLSIGAVEGLGFWLSGLYGPGQLEAGWAVGYLDQV